MNITPLAEHHDRETFDCGEPEITDWFRRHAWEQRSQVRSQVWEGPSRISGYYSLKTVSVNAEGYSSSISKKFDQNGLGVAILLCKLGVHLEEQGNGRGRALLLESIRTALDAHDRAPVNLLSVEALDEKRAQFYEKAGFTRTKDRPLRLYMSVRFAQQLIS